ncbi:MAG TPA: diguanylate cyclase [Bacillota bacterium]|nr:diguanylate cyclase [Bacillota bacterium]
MSDGLFAERLRSVYFTCMTKLSLYSFHQYLNFVAKEIYQTIDARYVGIYQKNEWSGTFELVTERFCHANKQLIIEATNKIKDSLFQQDGHHSHVNIPSFNVLTIPIYNNFQLSYFLVIIVSDDDLSPTKSKILDEETQKFFMTMHSMLDSQTEKTKSNFLTRLASRVFATSDLGSILKIVVFEVTDFYPTFTYHFLLSQDHEVEQGLPVKLIEYSDDATKRASTKAFMTGKMQVEDLREDGKTCLYVPLAGKQGVYGVLQVIVSQVMRIPEQEIHFFNRLGKITGQAIENASLYQTSHHLIQDLKLINKVAHKLNSNLNISEIIPLVKEQLNNIFKPSEIAFVYYDEEQKNLPFKVASESSAFFRTTKGQEFIHSLSNQMTNDHEPIFSGDYTKIYPTLDYCSLVAIPMIHGNMLQGFVVILHEEPSAFSFQDSKLAESIIRHSALAQANAILNEQLERAVITDYLTKLYSRNYLDETIHMHMQIDALGTLIIFDIDDFKDINDVYGHHVGDKVIIQVANILKDNCIKDSIPARWGGEELALYLPHLNVHEAVTVAETIRKKVKQTTKPHVTLSSGVAMWKKGDKLNVNDLFIRSDQALYTAKNNGKNQVVIDPHSL